MPQTKLYLKYGDAEPSAVTIDGAIIADLKEGAQIAFALVGKYGLHEISICTKDGQPLPGGVKLDSLVTSYDDPLFLKTQSAAALAPTVGGVSRQVEPHVNLEGVDLADRLTLFRVDKCRELLTGLSQHKIVLIRASPMSGKTALGQVLEKMTREGKSVYHTVYFFSLLAWNQKNEGFEAAFENKHGISIYEAFKHGPGTLIIFDETQMLYEEQDTFWQAVKNLKQNKEGGAQGAHVAFLAAYGESPNQSGAKTGTPIDFTKTYSASFMAYTLEEMESYRENFNATKWGTTSRLSPELAKAIHRWNGGHPGLIAKTCFAIGDKYFNHSNILVDSRKIMEFLLSSDMMAILNATRALTGGQGTAFELEPEEITYLKDVIHAPDLQLKKIAHDKTGQGLIKKGILGTIDELNIGFVSPLACSIYINRLYKTKTSSASAFSSLPELLVNALPKMDKTILQRSLSRSANGIHYERQFQVEFYRCVMECMGTDQGYCSPDIGSMFGSKGFLDFYVDSNYQWGVELVRESNRLQEHINRFKDTGIYSLIPFKAHIILDFVRKEDMATVPGTHSEDKAVWKVYYHQNADYIYVVTVDNVKQLSLLPGIQKRIRSS